jgi:hypothetical protein
VCEKTTKEVANNIVLFLNGNTMLIVLCFHLTFFSNKEFQTALYTWRSLTTLSLFKVHNGLLAAIFLLFPVLKNRNRVKTF